MNTLFNVERYFDGYKWHEGPFQITLKEKIIHEIIKQSSYVDNPDGLDVKGKFMSPPLVDGHTHLIFAGDRSFELPLKVRGASYAEILEKGGGILTTVEHTRSASDKELLELVLKRLDVMMSFGTLTVEAKSGYGLTPEEELRLLKILNQANSQHAVNVIPTYCGAHALPKDVPRKEYVEQVISILPEIKKNGLAVSTDVFCDRGAFTVEETERILSASLDEGLPIRVHADELEYTGIGKLAAEKYDALSVDHLLLAKEDDFEAISLTQTVSMFMPAAPIGLFSATYPSGWNKFPNLTIGLGSDFNPNNLVVSMQTAMRFATFLYRMPPQMALKAATSGSWKGITGEDFTPLHEGSEATFALWDAPTIEYLLTRMDQNMLSHLFVEGKVQVNNSSPKI